MNRADIMDHHKKFIRAVFDERGQFHAMGFLFITRGPDGETLPDVMAAPILAPDTETLSTMMRAGAKRLGAIAAIICAEVWMANARPEEMKTGEFQPASEREDRTEHLMVIAEIEGEREGWSASITRDAAGKGIAGDWERMPGVLAGRLTGLLPNLN